MCLVVAADAHAPSTASNRQRLTCMHPLRECQWQAVAVCPAARLLASTLRRLRGSAAQCSAGQPQIVVQRHEQPPGHQRQCRTGQETLWAQSSCSADLIHFGTFPCQSWPQLRITLHCPDGSHACKHHSASVFSATIASLQTHHDARTRRAHWCELVHSPWCFCPTLLRRAITYRGMDAVVSAPGEAGTLLQCAQ